MVGLLNALPKTPLYERLEAASRLRENDGNDNTKAGTNVVPKSMSYTQLIDGYQAMYRRLTRDRAIAQRIRNKLRFMPTPVYKGEYGPWQRIVVVTKLLFRGIARGGVARIWYFARSLPLMTPRKLPVVLVDWIAGLSMQNYVDRHFQRDEQTGGRRTQELLERVVQVERRHSGDARSALSVTMTDVPSILIRVDSNGSAHFLRRIR